MQWVGLIYMAGFGGWVLRWAVWDGVGKWRCVRDELSGRVVRGRCFGSEVVCPVCTTIERGSEGKESLL